MRNRSLLALAAATTAIGVAVIALGAGSPTAPPAAAPARSASVALPARAVLPAPQPQGVPPLVDLLAGVTAADDADRPELAKRTHQALVAALARDPAATLAALERFLADANPKLPATRLAVGALVVVGTPQAQAALVRALQGRAGDEGFAKLVLPSLGFLAHPDVATEAAVRELARDGVALVTRTTANLSLGIMAAHLAETEPDRATAIVEGYAARLASARTPEQRREILSVLGNAGTPEAAAAIASQLEAADAASRSRAAEALRRVMTPEAETQLAHALGDDDPRVRSSAAWSLGYRGPSTETIHAMVAMLPGEPDAEVASSLLDTLWAKQAVDRDAVVAAVRAAAANHPSPKIREQASKLLSGAS